MPSGQKTQEGQKIWSILISVHSGHVTLRGKKYKLNYNFNSGVPSQIALPHSGRLRHLAGKTLNLGYSGFC